MSRSSPRSLARPAPRPSPRLGAACCAALLLLAACGAPVAPPPATPIPPRTVDLSQVVRQDVPYPPDEPHTRLERGPDGRLRALTIGANTGSRLELIATPGAAVTSVEQLAPRDLILPAAVIDVRDQAQNDPGFALSIADVEAWERAHGPIAPGSLVLLVTGWDVYWGDPATYLRRAPSEAVLAPGFSPAAARLLLETRGAAGLALDSPAPPPASPAEVDHWLWLANLTSLEQLPPTGATITIGALKLQAAQSSPARVFAIIP